MPTQKCQRLVLFQRQVCNKPNKPFVFFPHRLKAAGRRRIFEHQNLPEIKGLSMPLSCTVPPQKLAASNVVFDVFLKKGKQKRYTGQYVIICNLSPTLYIVSLLVRSGQNCQGTHSIAKKVSVKEVRGLQATLFFPWSIMNQA